MWAKIASFILRFRNPLLLALLIFTAYMGYRASDVQLSYDMKSLTPASNPKYQEYQKIKKIFGKDDNILLLGVQAKDKTFTLSFYKDWHKLGNEIKSLEGISDVISVSHINRLVKNDSTKKFQFQPLLDRLPRTQRKVDSLKETFFNLPFYHGLIYDKESHTSLMVVRFEDKVLDSKQRVGLVDKLKESANEFSLIHDTEVHYSGLPFIRTIISAKVADELKIFTVLALLVTALILFLFFRSIYMVFAPLLVVVVSVIWSLGIIVLLGYKLTILTGLLPPLIVVIGIPNCIYLLNRYHSEFKKHGNKIKALSRVVEKVGMATFITNLTTAIGFGVFAFTGSQILEEFGVVSFLNIMSTFVISIILIPSIFSFLPQPGKTEIKYLESYFMQGWLRIINHWIQHYRIVIYSIASVLFIAALIGIFQVRANGYMVDDIPHNAKEYTDLKFFEKHFNGVMPFQIIINTHKKGGATKLSTIRKINKVQKIVKNHSKLSEPLSIARGIKYITQAYYDGNPQKYQIPNRFEKNFIMPYLSKMEGQQQLVNRFLDSTRQITKISTQMADIGSAKLPNLLSNLRQKVYKVLDTSRYGLSFTGTSVVFLEGYNYLNKSLFYSLGIAFLLIAFIMGILFKDIKMLFICLIPNIIPLVITGGIMGYFNLPLKPSTVLVFSVAFGIAVDTSIHFLAKYQQEIKRHNWEATQTISVALHETGRSMIYNSLILFFGFVIFSASSFGGTSSLGVLTSITLVVAMFTNTVLLPSLLLSVESISSLRPTNNQPFTFSSNHQNKSNEQQYLKEKDQTKKTTEN